MKSASVGCARAAEAMHAARANANAAPWRVAGERRSGAGIILLNGILGERLTSDKSFILAFAGRARSMVKSRLSKCAVPPIRARPTGIFMARRNNTPRVGVVMGSANDWEIMQHAVAQLAAFGVPHEAR